MATARVAYLVADTGGALPSVHLIFPCAVVQAWKDESTSYKQAVHVCCACGAYQLCNQILFRTALGLKVWLGWHGHIVSAAIPAVARCFFWHVWFVRIIGDVV